MHQLEEGHDRSQCGGTEKTSILLTGGFVKKDGQGKKQPRHIHRGKAKGGGAGTKESSELGPNPEAEKQATRQEQSPGATCGMASWSHCSLADAR